MPSPEGFLGSRSPAAGSPTPPTELNSMATISETQQLYVAYFGRPADPAGLDYWVSTGITTKNFAAAMYAQPEFQQANANLSVTNQVNALYLHLFGRNGDTEGLLYWTQQINTGKLSLASIANDLIFAANNSTAPQSVIDKTVLNNKTATAIAYTDQVRASSASLLAYNPTSTTPWVTGPQFTSADAYLTTVTTTAPTAAATTAAVAAMTAISAPSQTFTLTTGIDTVSATSQNSSIIGVGAGVDAVITPGSTTINAGDRISSIAANATLELTLTNSGVAAVSTFGQGFRATNIPNITVSSFGGGAFGSVLDLASFDATSATSLSNIGSSGVLTFNNVGNLATLNITRVTAATTVQFLDALVPTGNTTAAAVVNVNGASNAGNAVGVTLRGVTAATDGPAVVTVNAVGAQSDIGLNSGTNTLRTLTVNSAAANTVNMVVAGTGTRTLNFTGAGTSSVDITGSTQAVTVVGGAGNDTVIFADAQLNVADSIALGAGTNNLGISIAAAANGAAITSAAGINAATGVSSLLLVGQGTTVGNAGTTFFNAVNFSAVNPTRVVLDGFTAATGAQDYATTAGGAGGTAFTASNVTTAKTLVISGDMSGTAATASTVGNAGGAGGAGAAGNAGAVGATTLTVTSATPLQALNLVISAGSRDLGGVAIAGGAGSAGSNGGAGANNNVGGAGGAGAAGLAAITAFTNINTINLTSSASSTSITNTITGGAAGAGGNGGAGTAGNAGNIGGAGGAGANAAVAIANNGAETFNILGAARLTIAGGGAAAAGTAGAANGGVAGGVAGVAGLRALGFAQQVNIQGATATGNLSLQGSGALITNGGAAITSGAVLSVGDVIVTGTGSDTITGGGAGDIITTGTGSDRIAYITGNAGEIASGDGTPTAAEFGNLTDIALIDRITDFTTASDKITINTGLAFFSTADVTFTAATATNVGSFTGITGNAITNITGLTAAFNTAVTGGAVASGAGTAQAYVFTTGSITGGLANASNQTFLVLNNGTAAIGVDDFLINITGITGTFAGSNFNYAAV